MQKKEEERSEDKKDERCKILRNKATGKGRAERRRGKLFS